MQCNKKPFDTKLEAERKLREIKEFEAAKTEGKSEKIPVRMYVCGTCGKYHLTSLNRSEFDKRQNLIKQHRVSRIHRTAKTFYKKSGLWNASNFEKFKKQSNRPLDDSADFFNGFSLKHTEDWDRLIHLNTIEDEGSNSGVTDTYIN